MNFETLDLNIEKHKHAFQYFALCGHPFIYLNGKPVDADIEWRDYIVEEFLQDYPVAYCDSNGSSYKILSFDMGKCRIQFEFYFDDQDGDPENYEGHTNIDIAGELKYCPELNQCVFFPNEDTLTII